MKKILSLFCAMAIVFSASAAPQFAVKGIEKQGVEMVKKATVSSDVLAKPAFKVQTKRAPQAQQATTDVTIVAIQAGYSSNAEGYQYILAGENDYYYIFTFSSTGADPVVNGQTYTFADMDDFWSYLYKGSYNYVDFVAPTTFTKTVDANNKIKIVASATDKNGDVWNLTYDEASQPEMPQGGTFVADEVEGTYYSSYSDIQYILTFTDAMLVFSFDIKLPSGQKDVISGQTYTLADMDEEYTYGAFNKITEITIVSASFTKVDAADGSYTISATAVDDKSNTWKLSAAGTAPEVPTLVVLPEGAVVEEYAMAFKNYDGDADSKFVNVAVVGNDVYFQGMSEYMTTAWSKGTKEGNIVTFAANQWQGDYLGSYPCYSFYQAAQFTYDANADTYSATGDVYGLLQYGSDNYYDGFYTNPVLSKPALPDPIEVAIVDANGEYDSYYEDIIYTLTNAAKDTTFVFDINLEDTGLTDVASGQEYTLNDMYSSTTYTYLQAGENKVGFSKVSFVKTVSAGGDIRIEVTAIDANMIVYHFIYIKEEEPTAVENANVAVKAVKSIKEGQLIIRANGKNFNAQGVEIR